MLQPSFWRPLVVVAATLLGALVYADSAAAQTPTESELTGTIRTLPGEPVQRAVITLFDVDGRPLRTFEGGLDGTFTLRGVGMGRYDLRIEALGFRPRVVTGVRLRPGETTRVRVVLDAAGAGIDTVAAVGGSGALATERWLDAPDLESSVAALPALDRQLSLSTAMGDGLGMTGLPGAHTSIFIDGLPFRPVFPLGLRETARGLGLVTTRSAAAVQVGPGLDGFALPAGAGGRISVHTVRGGEAPSRLDGAGSGDPVSLQAGALASITAEESGTRVALGADVWQVEQARAGFLGGGGGEIDPEVDQQRGVAAFARVDHPVEGGTLWGTGRLAIQPERTDHTGVAWGIVDGGERVDVLVGGGLVAPVGRREVLDVRLGLGRSAWSSGPAASGVPTAASLHAITGARVGPGPVHVEAAHRFDADLIGNLVMDRGAHRFLIGFRGGVALHTHDPGEGLWTTHLLGGEGPPPVGVSEGWRYRGAIDATVPRVGVVAEDRWAAASGVEVHFGAAFDSEWIPILDIFPNSDWFDASGLGALAREEQVSGVSGFANLVWGAGTGTEFRVATSYATHPFDPTLMMEVLGSVDNEWIRIPRMASEEEIGGHGGLRGVAYLAKDPEAPATARLSAGFTHAAGPVEVALGGLFRHSEGLTRRRDLNRAAVPHGVDEHGRALWAQPLKVGGWLGQDPETASRFEQWGPVMEIDQGGWSEYVGVTGRVSWRSASGVRLTGEYTWSRTEDNVPGVGAQGVRTGVPFMAEVGDDPTAGVSDLDRPHRVTALLAVPLPVGDDSRVSAVWRFMSGAPFTPGYAAGVDANLDGVVGNDPAFVGADAAAAHSGWSCLRGDVGGFATRNGCRGADQHSLDLRLDVGIAGSGVGLFVDVLNALDQERSLLDTALLGVDPGAADASFLVNPGFGSALVDRSTGRVFRVGLRVVR